MMLTRRIRAIPRSSWSSVSVLGLARILVVQQVVDGQSHLRVGKAERSAAT